MIDACVNMLARDSADYIEPCLESVLPYVNRAIVLVDSRSKDCTWDILKRMKTKWPDKLEPSIFCIREPFRDLVAARNFMLSRITERFGWIVDSDEYYPPDVMPKLERVLRKVWGVMAFGLSSWAVWDEKQAHKVTSGRYSTRIFRNSSNLTWHGQFGNEKLMLGDIDLCDEFLPLDFKYVHFTHLKADKWREELGHKRRIDVNNVALVPLPDNIITIVDKLYGKYKKV